MMRILLARSPSILSMMLHQADESMPHIGLAYLAGTLTAKGYDVTGLDPIGLALERYTPLDERPGMLSRGLTPQEMASRPEIATADIIGFSIMFTHEWPVAREALRLIRQRNPRALIVAGGEHITAEPEFSLRDGAAIDICVLGEGEETLLEIVEKYERSEDITGIDGTALLSDKTYIQNPSRRRILDVDQIPLPDWSVLPIEPYIENYSSFQNHLGSGVMPILASRGCPYQCTFCSNPVMWTQKWIARTPDLVLDEMEHYIEKYQVDNFVFFDLTAIVRKDWIVEFCDKLLARGIICTFQFPAGTRSEAIDAEVCEKLARSGCTQIAYAPESGSPAVLKRIKKMVHLDRLAASMRSARKAGLKVRAHLIIGFPDETHREIWETVRFAIKMAIAGVHEAFCNNYLAYPGTENYNNLKAKGHLPELDDNFCYEILEIGANLRRGMSFSQSVSNRALGFYRLCIILSFYGVSFLVRPWNLWSLLKNIALGHGKSLNEIIFIRYLRRRREFMFPRKRTIAYDKPSV